MQSTEPSFSVPPFPAFPAISRFVPIGSIQEAYDRVCRSVDARERVSLVVGPPGTGKSLVTGLLANHYGDSHDVVLLGETPIESRSELLRQIVAQLELTADGHSDGELQLEIKRYVCGEEASPAGMLLIIDESQSLSVEVIESIRLLTNLMRQGEPRVHAVLAGGVKLEETLVANVLEPFTQRLATRCYLHAFNGEESREYILNSIRACGAEPEATITREATAAVHHACLGVPRLINQIMTEAIDCAEECGQDLIDEGVIERAWARLQQLPSPMVEEPKIQIGSSSTVEFGELSADINGDVDAVIAVDKPETTAETTGPVENIAPIETSQVETTQPVAESPSEIDEVTLSEPLQTSEAFPSGWYPGAEEVSDDLVLGESEHDLIIEERALGQPQGSESIDEPKENAVAPTQESISPEALFGDFDEEEVLNVGSGAPVSRLAEQAAPPADLEAMLHQEIVGIASFAADALEAYQDDCSDDSVDRADGADDAATGLKPVVELTEDFGDQAEAELASEERMAPGSDIDAVDECEPDFVDNEVNETPVLFLDEESGAEEFSEAEASKHDDSDMLIIEDDIPVETPGTVKMVDPNEQTVSVDFQAMLARMRNGA